LVLALEGISLALFLMEKNKKEVTECSITNWRCGTQGDPAAGSSSVCVRLLNQQPV